MFVEIASNSINYHGDRMCGDSFMQRYIANQRRTVAVLSDGMGHGTKANILSTLTASIIVNMGQANHNISQIAKIIVKTLPVCAVRGISYSTFTIIDIDHLSSQVQILEYDNPQTMVLRGSEPLPIEWQCQQIEAESDRQTLLTTSFQARKGDRIVFCSDGVTQSGLGRVGYSFGWGVKNLFDFVLANIKQKPYINSQDLSLEVLKQAFENDERRSKDDISCAVVTFRAARSLMLASCPPMVAADCDKLARKIIEYPQQTIICGYPLAQMVSQSLSRPIRKNITSTDPELPPLWFIDGVDLVTEGLLTLSKVVEILEDYENRPTGRGPAYRVVRMLLAADQIELVIGLKEQTEPTEQLSDNYTLRRKQLERIAHILEKKFSKQISKVYN